MAYEGGYGGPGQHRPYAGPAAPRSAPRGYNDRPPPTRQYEPQPQYNDYNDGYGYEGQAGGYGHQPQDYGQAPQGQRRPSQDYYGPGVGGGGRPMPPAGRGGPGPRPSTAEDHRGHAYPPRGRGMGPAPDRGMPGGRGGPAPDFHGRRPPMNGPPGRREPGYSPDQALPDQMSAMSLHSQRSGSHPQGRSSSESYRGPGEYGRQFANGAGGPQSRDYPRQGPAPGREPAGYGGYEDGYSADPNMGPRHDFGPPGRSMTMPVQDSGARQAMPAPQRVDSMPFSGPAGRGMPPRPSTTTGTRPVPQRTYPEDASANNQYGGAYHDSRGYGNQPAPAVDDFFDSYFDNDPVGNTDHGSQAPPHRSSLPDFDSAPPQRRGSFEQAMLPGPQQPHQGAHQTPRLHHAKSEANVREPQAAVFEMAGDIPSVPAVPHIKPYQPEFSNGYGGSGGYEPMPPPARGPSVPPGPGGGPRPGGFARGDMSRTHTGLSQSTNSDSLPSHPTPVRPGLMANSMVSMQDRPPPVRNYTGVPQGTPAQPQAPPPPQQQPQQQPRMAARAGHQVPEVAPLEEPVTQQELERLRMVIKGNANDQASALRLAKKLIEAADVLAPRLPDPKQRMRARERYLLDAHKILKKLSNAQNQDAMFIMADSIGRGLFGHEPDNKEAFTLYQSAAKLGNAAAAYRTAVCCEIGHEEGGGTRKDPLKAMQWYKRAATLGDPPAMYKVGMILLKGLLGQPRNPREAVGWLKRAAEQADSENPHALHELGLLYESAQPNDAIIRDELYALNLFQQAADLGYKFSQFRLGCAYEFGLLGCPIDPRQSIFWYSKAATQEEHQSELALSGWYLTGSEGVLNQSDTEAYLWARKAAVAGLAKAEYAMGYFTETGIGIPANLEDAKRWYWRAAAQDFPKARERLEDLKRAGKNGYPRQRERISRSRIEKQQDGECTVM